MSIYLLESREGPPLFGVMRAGEGKPRCSPSLLPLLCSSPGNPGSDLGQLELLLEKGFQRHQPESELGKGEIMRGWL